jgi:hypothetical protein
MGERACLYLRGQLSVIERFRPSPFRGNPWNWAHPPQVLKQAPEYGDVLVDRFPPPGVWRQVDEAARNADDLWSGGREIDFGTDESGRLRISLVEAGMPVRELSVLEALAVAAGAPV